MGGGENREVIVYVRVRQPSRLVEAGGKREGRQRRVPGMGGLEKKKKRREKAEDRMQENFIGLEDESLSISI